MAGRIEDYGIIGDTRTVALVDRGGSIDWWCAPRIDSPAAMAALLGTREHGRWLIAPTEPATTTREYEPDTLVLSTRHVTSTGTVDVIDFMLPDHAHPTIFRILQGVSGHVDMTMDLVVRFDYGSVVPWVRSAGDGLTLVAGPDALRFHSPYPLTGEDHSTTASFTLQAGQERTFSLAWHSSLVEAPMPLDGRAAHTHTQQWWREWAGRCTDSGPLRAQTIRSLITLKALTYAPTGAVVAAATTSLPELIGGVRNWDYRYSWLRDSSFSLQALLSSGYTDEAVAWMQWLSRAVAGDPGDFQIMYDVFGRRRLTEIELDWLPGYEGSRPVRVGNAASKQFQLDVFGELLDSRLASVQAGLMGTGSRHHDLLLPAMEILDRVWELPDEGIWEIRGAQQHFTHSKVMAWVAYDRAVQLADLLDRDDLPVERWAVTRDRIHAQVCERGWDPELGTFVQYYGAKQVDSSLLMLARVGFLPATDQRIVGTVEAVRRDLEVSGFVMRYPTMAQDGSDGVGVDGLPEGEGVFLMTTLWLADNLVLMGRLDEAREVFERVCAVRNDLGLFAEEYDPAARRQLGNFPQAFSHLGHIVTARLLDQAERPVRP
jgi:GH15 family glucan-1,4-alpha-glucosidase